MSAFVNDVETLAGAGGILSIGHVLDTIHIPRLIVELRWVFDVPPDKLYFTPLGTNSANHPDVPLGFHVIEHSNLHIEHDGKVAEASNQETGRGFLTLRDMPRFVAVATYATGTFTMASITLHAYGWGR